MPSAETISLWVATLTFFGGMVTWFVSHSADRRARQSAHTADFIAQIHSNECLSDANFIVAKLIRRGVKVKLDQIGEDENRALVALLNHYEYICALSKRNILDEKIVHDLRTGPMCRAYDISEDLIREIRLLVDAPRLYEFLEEFRKQNLSKVPPRKDKSLSNPLA